MDSFWFEILRWPPQLTNYIKKYENKRFLLLTSIKNSFLFQLRWKAETAKHFYQWHPSLEMSKRFLKSSNKLTIIFEKFRVWPTKQQVSVKFLVEVRYLEKCNRTMEIIAKFSIFGPCAHGLVNIIAFPMTAKSYLYHSPSMRKLAIKISLYIENH